MTLKELETVVDRILKIDYKLVVAAPLKLEIVSQREYDHHIYYTLYVGSIDLDMLVRQHKDPTIKPRCQYKLL